MPFKNLLVHMDDSKSCAVRIAAAADLAANHEAHLTGLAIAAEPNLPNFAYNQLQAEVLAEMREQIEAQAKDLAANFTKTMDRRGITAETRASVCLQSEISQLIGLHGRYADLVIMGQADPDAPPPGGRHLPEEVSMSSGRPVLVVPYIGAQKTIGEHVTVAWDAGREAARAVSDALPALTKAKSVQILVVNPVISNNRHGDSPGADIALCLARHGVEVDVHRVESREISIGDTILSAMADRGSDLLVMGAYGHTRLQEIVFGGVTRHIMAHMTVPVLLSH